jgi:hypothetical protein
MEGPPQDSEARKASQHAEIDRRYRRPVARDVSKRNLVSRLRFRDLERIFRARYGSLLENNAKWLFPDDDAGRDDLRLLLEHLCGSPTAPLSIPLWSRRAPWISDEELRDLVQEISAHPRGISADSVGHRLRLTYNERKRLRVTTIFCVNKTREEVAALQKEEKRQRDRERQRRNRESTRHDATTAPRSSLDRMSPRAEAVYYNLGSRWQIIKRVCAAVGKLPAFEDLSPDSLRVVVHRAIKELYDAGLVDQKRESLPGRLARLLVRRCQPNRNSRVSPSAPK